MNRAPVSPRKYSSRLREEQSEQTRERIISSVVALLQSGEIDDLTIASVAGHAGVSVPTVYRYFPSRDALFHGVEQWIGRELKGPAFPGDWTELADTAPALHEYYEKAGDLFRAASITSLFRDVDWKARRKRDQTVAKLLSPLTTHLDERSANAIHALFRLMYGFETYSFVHERFGVTAAEASAAIAFVTRTVTAELVRQQATTNGGAKRARTQSAAAKSKRSRGGRTKS